MSDRVNIYVVLVVALLIVFWFELRFLLVLGMMSDLRCILDILNIVDETRSHLNLLFYQISSEAGKWYGNTSSLLLEEGGNLGFPTVNLVNLGFPTALTRQ